MRIYWICLEQNPFGYLSTLGQFLSCWNCSLQNDLINQKKNASIVFWVGYKCVLICSLFHGVGVNVTYSYLLGRKCLLSQLLDKRGNVSINHQKQSQGEYLVKDILLWSNERINHYNRGTGFLFITIIYRFFFFLDPVILFGIGSVPLYNWINWENVWAQRYYNFCLL